MNSLTDQQLLREYAQDRSEAAFAELVRRRVDLVYSAALRMVRDAHLAQDVTQGAFLALAQNASRLTDRPVLSGWLHRTAQNLAAKIVRSEVRRRAREQEAANMNELLADATDATWEHIAPHLDAALGDLSDADRDALMLRYFERKTAQEMAQALGISDDAAQKRVNRAVDRLREHLAKRGIAAGAAGLAAIITANAVQAAPAGMAATIASAASALTAATLATATKAIVMTTLQKTLVAAALVATIGTGVYEARQVSNLRAQNQTLQQQQATLAGQMQELQQGRNDVSNRLAALRDENAALKNNQSELLKQRAELTRLRAETQAAADTHPASDSAAETAKAWLNRVQLLKARLAATPGAGIPELSLLKDKDWLQAVQDNKLETDDDYQKAFKAVRNTAQSDFAGLVQSALKQYVATNNGAFPTDLSQLQPFLSSPVDPAVLARWTVASSWAVPNVGVGDNMIITQKSAADPRYDNVFAVGIGGYGSTSPPSPGTQNLLQTLDPALLSYYNANGQIPSDPLQLLPYATTAAQTNLLVGAAKDYLTMSPTEKAAAQKEIQQEIQKLMPQTPPPAK